MKKRLRCTTADHDEQAAIMEKIPDFPVDEMETTYDDWTWEYIMKMKEHQCSYRGERSVCMWKPQNVKLAFMNELYKNGLSEHERKHLVKEYNRALGASQYPHKWPETLAWAIESIAPLPLLDKRIFRKSSPFFAKLLAAVYGASTYNGKPFIFAPRCYGALLGCSGKTVYKFVNKLVSLGVMRVVERGVFVPGRKKEGKHTWYALTDAERLLDLFTFADIGERERFAHAIATLPKPMNGMDWEEYVIDQPWLYANRLLK